MFSIYTVSDLGVLSNLIGSLWHRIKAGLDSGLWTLDSGPWTLDSFFKIYIFVLIFNNKLKGNNGKFVE